MDAKKLTAVLVTSVMLAAPIFGGGHITSALADETGEAAQGSEVKVSSLDELKQVMGGTSTNANENQTLIDGQTIRLEDNITFDDSDSSSSIVIDNKQNVTLDLNGHTLTTTRCFYVQNDTVFTIMDSTDSKNGKISFTQTAYMSVKNSTLNIESGTIEAPNNAESGSCNYVINLGENGTLNMTGGTIRTKADATANPLSYCAIITDAESKAVNISGGSVTAYGGVGIKLNDSSTTTISGNASVSGLIGVYAYDGEPTLNITGGSITSEEYGYAVYADTYTTVDMSGGEMNSFYNGIYVTGYGTLNSTITGGKINSRGGYYCIWIDEYGTVGSIDIQGGYFSSSDDVWAYLNQGSALTSTDEEMYQVIKPNEAITSSGTYISAVINGVYEQGMFELVDISGTEECSKKYNITFTGEGDTPVLEYTCQNNTAISGSGSVLFGLIVTDIPVGKTLEITVE